jgi:hypothetical protein
VDLQNVLSDSIRFLGEMNNGTQQGIAKSGEKGLISKIISRLRQSLTVRRHRPAIFIFQYVF